MEDYSGDPDALGAAEKYFAVLGKVPSLELRAKALKYYITFEDQLETLAEVSTAPIYKVTMRKGVDAILGASKILLRSKPLNYLLCMCIRRYSKCGSFSFIHRKLREWWYKPRRNLWL